MIKTDLTGQKFGKLTVLYLSHKSKDWKKYWRCKCECGNSKTIYSGHLKSGHTKSCGCITINRMKANKMGVTHGMSNTPTYISWRGIINRCTLKNHKDYPHYGGRGITFCDRWSEFENFLEDMGERPKGMTIDRKDNSKSYTPENCKWATNKEQHRNTRSNRFITYLGETKTVAEWAEIAGIKYRTVLSRLRIGWSIEKTLTTKIQIHKRRN